MNKILDVYLNEKLVGKFQQDLQGRFLFQYDEHYIADQNSYAISRSMPLSNEIYQDQIVRPFFNNILPEGNVRELIAKYLGVSPKNPYSLLRSIGGECAGALAFYPLGQIPPKQDKKDIEILNDKRLLEILNIACTRPLLAGMDNIRISLAGAQNKLAVTKVDDKIAIIHGTTPTTHILKPLIEGIDESVQNELFCLKLAKLVGINTPNVEMNWVADIPYFLVERYDRVRSKDGEILRIHQEDFCQALSIMPEQKYENEGGPSIKQSLELISDVSSLPITDRRKFLQLIIFNYLIGNSDAHGKNFSFLYKNNMSELAPAYDLLCTEVYPHVSLKMAMKIGSKYDPYAVSRRHWHKLVPDTTLARAEIDDQLLKFSKLCVEQAYVLKAILKDTGITASVFDSIIKVIEKRATIVAAT